MKPIKYREIQVRNAGEFLASQLKHKNTSWVKDLPKQGVNTASHGDMYAEPLMPDCGYPGWITGNGHGPLLNKSAMATSAMRLAPDVDPVLSSFSYNLAGGLADRMAHGKPRLQAIGRWLSDIGTRPGQAALKGSIGGAVLGAGAGLATGRSPFWSGLMGSAAGGLGSLGAGLFAKTANTLLSDLRYISERILRDAALPEEAQSELMAALGRLKADQANDLAGLLRASAGAGVGVLVARYLLRLGLVGTSIFALLGAGLAFGLGRKNRNAFGERADSNKDPLGRPRL